MIEFLLFYFTHKAPKTSSSKSVKGQGASVKVLEIKIIIVFSILVYLNSINTIGVQ